MITITIPKNDYVKPSEPRQDVVQRMVNYIVKEVNRIGGVDFCANNCWRATCGIGYNKTFKCDEFFTHCDRYDNYTNVERPTTCEMKALVKVWCEAGYYVSRGTYTVRNTAIIYKFSKKPYTDYGYRVVTEFTEDID